MDFLAIWEAGNLSRRFANLWATPRSPSAKANLSSVSKDLSTSFFGPKPQVRGFPLRTREVDQLGARSPQVQEELLLHFVDGVLGMYGRTLSELVLFSLYPGSLLHLHPKDGVNPFAAAQERQTGGDGEKFDKIVDLCIRATQQAEIWLRVARPCCHCYWPKLMLTPS